MNQYLIEAFKKLNKPQKEVINDLGKSQPYVSALMNGKKSVGKDVAKQLVQLYGFDFASIMSDDQGLVSEPEPKYTLEEKRAVKTKENLETLLDSAGETFVMTYIMERYDKFKNHQMFEILVNHHNTINK